jgi:hypothetical protein
MEDALRMVEAGGCRAWPLPADPTCAGIARGIFRRAAGELSLDPALADDGVTVVSELAANTLHAHRKEPPTGPELWLYLRGSGRRRELVCKVFDSYPGWLEVPVSGRVRRAAQDAMSGRGLEVVHEMSGGRWGYHLTRSRLSSWPVRGKAVWFAVPVSDSVGDSVSDSVSDSFGDSREDSGNCPRAAFGRARAQIPVQVPRAASAWRLPARAGDAMAEVEAGLVARGFGGELVRAGDPAADTAILSMPGLTIWCRAGTAWLRAPGTSGERWTYRDLVEVVEQAVEAHESLAEDTQARRLAGASRTGALVPLNPKCL